MELWVQNNFKIIEEEEKTKVDWKNEKGLWNYTNYEFLISSFSEPNYETMKAEAPTKTWKEIIEYWKEEGKFE